MILATLVVLLGVSNARAADVSDGSVIELPDHAGTVQLQPGSKAELIPGPTPGIHLTQGTAMVFLSNSAPKISIQSLSGTITAERGKFAVTADPSSDRTSVLVLEGTAELKNSQGQSVTLSAGQFSGISRAHAEMLPPTRVSPAQLESLRIGSTGFGKSASSKTSKPRELPLSPVPPGGSPRLFAASRAGVQKALEKTLGEPVQLAPVAPESAIVAGGYVDLKHGIYIAPPPGSPYDVITGLHVPPRNMGSFEPATGAYVPPPGADLEHVSGLLVGQAQDHPRRSMTAAPLPPGSDPAQFKPGPLQAPASTDTRVEAQFVPFYQDGRPEFPVYSPDVCPPYCGPVTQPARPSSAPAPNQPSGPTTVIFHVQ